MQAGLGCETLKFVTLHSGLLKDDRLQVCQACFVSNLPLQGM